MRRNIVFFFLSFLAACCFLLPINSCKKEKVFFTIHGQFINGTTGAGYKNMAFHADHTDWKSLSKKNWQVELGTFKTDENGNFNFTYEERKHRAGGINIYGGNIVIEDLPVNENIDTVFVH